MRRHVSTAKFGTEDDSLKVVDGHNRVALFEKLGRMQASRGFLFEASDWILRDR